MNIFFKDHQEILNALLQKGVSFILSGCYAVNYYGYNRATSDLDIWLKPDNDNKTLLLTAFA